MFYYSYECLDPTQVIAHSQNEDFLETTVRVECLFNGQWSYNIQEFGCTQCQRPMKPLNGKFDCETFNFTEQSSCFLVTFFLHSVSDTLYSKSLKNVDYINY